ncbi:MAG: DMT family transporter, partial [Clostridium sp.]|nr:DMT family transporter [Clostridium sp.]
VCGLRSLIAAVALCAFIRPKQLNWNIWMLIYVCSYAALCMTIIMALKMTSAPIAIGMQYTAIIWLFLVGVIRTKKFDFRSFVPVAVVFAGVIFFMLSGTDAASSTGNMIALMEGVFFALMTVSSKKAAGTNVIGMTAVANIFTGVVMCIIFPSNMATISAMTTRDWIIMIILGVVQVGGGYCFYNMGVQKVSAQKASVISLWEMILGPLWVALFLKEYPSVPVLIGFVIILIGMFLDAKMSSTPAEAEVSK